MSIEYVEYTATRVIATSHLAYDEVCAAFERHVPVFDVTLIPRLQQRNATWAEFEEAVTGQLGPSGFTHMLRVDHGGLLALAGRRGRASLYVFGNPMIAPQRLTEHDVAAPLREYGLYAPMRLEIYEGADGTTRIAYDLPSSLLGAVVGELSAMLDEKVAELVRVLDVVPFS